MYTKLRIKDTLFLNFLVCVTHNHGENVNIYGNLVPHENDETQNVIFRTDRVKAHPCSATSDIEWKAQQYVIKSAMKKPKV